MENKTPHDMRLTVKDETTGGVVQIIGKPFIDVQKDGQGNGTFFIVMDKKSIKKKKTEIKLGLYEEGKKIAEAKTIFLGPVGE